MSSKKIAITRIVLCILIIAIACGGCSTPRALYTDSGAHILDSLGRYTPDEPPVIDPSPDNPDVHRDVRADIEKIPQGDWTLIEALQENYGGLSVREFRERFHQQCGQSNTLVESASALAYAGMYDDLEAMDDFYASLYFTLQEYYQHYGPENVRDANYLFIYSRYFGEKHERYTEENYDITQFVIMSYAIQIDYPDDDLLMVESRNLAIAAAIGEINAQIDLLTAEDWQRPNAADTFTGILTTALSTHSTQWIQFRLDALNYEPMETISAA